jgi:hypothetical protein
MSKSVTMPQLLSYRAVTSNNQFLTFPSPEEILSPVFRQLEGRVSSYDCRVQEPDLSAVDTKEGAVSETYKYAERVLVEAYLEDTPVLFGDGTHRTVIGMLYAHDVSKPTMTLYLGFENSACMNLAVFNPMDIARKEFLTADFNTIYDRVGRMLDTVEERKQLMQRVYPMMHEEILAGEKLRTAIGHIAMRSHSSVSMKQNFNGMMDSVFKPKGKYAGQELTRYVLYQALTNTMGKEQIVSNRPDKVLEAYTYFYNDQA